MGRHIVSTALLSLAAAFLAACGGGEDATPTATSEPPPASTEAATAAPSAEATAANGGGGDTSGLPEAPVLGAFVDAGESTVRVNTVAEPETVNMIDPIPDGLRLVSIDVSMVAKSYGKEYNKLFFGLLRADGQNIAIRVEPGVSGPGNPGALQLVPRQPPLKAGSLFNGNLVRGWVHSLVPEDSGPLLFAVLNDAGDDWVALAIVDGAAEPGPGTGPPMPGVSAGLPLISAEGTSTMSPIGGSGYEILEVLDPAPTNDDAPDGMRFVALNIRQTALQADERINLLDFAVQDADGYLYYAFFDLGMARPNFQSSQGGESGEGFVTFAILEDAELVSVLAQPDFMAPHEHIARFGE